MSSESFVASLAALCMLAAIFSIAVVNWSEGRQKTTRVCLEKGHSPEDCLVFP